MNQLNNATSHPKTILLQKSNFVREYKEFIGRKILLDCRNPDETALGILPNACVIPLPDLQKRISEIPLDSVVFIYCRTGNRAKTAALALEAIGIQKIKIAIDCGYAELKNEITQ